MNEVPYLRRTEPHVPVDHPDFVWTPLGDCQAIWRRYGWKPLAELQVEQTMREQETSP